MARSWNDVERFTVATATRDLEEHGEVRPLLLAFTGEDPCFFAFLRWFPKGRYADPMIELLSLAVALEADRLAFSITGRLTSLDDPIPPVTEDGDLRQRALVVEYADGRGGPVRRHSLIHPFTVADRAVTWGAPVRLTDGQGWITAAMGLAVERRGMLTALADDAAARDQALRCVTLGHDLSLDAAVSARLGLESATR